ncbi:UbiA prenyltransferase [Coniophora puteana RWD-64-598 SS2]|uniref:4-hydroxybenzoate polyprenyltransferase, mitochondrial n=1 Tax=Coniophora puteana (strain RWD-64-598) TaxID=741705 RepID=A0A5M3N3H3_CONPW|nr:UbiA prenyltransferase [Coniophora puteana RWD-64-598 SS2]EIW85886.1 UbiA prenyltransferase [Coniophora puteana RWD-64-598 SS2]
MKVKDALYEDARPYLELMRVHKPIGVYLMFWPFAWGLTLAARRQRLDFPTYVGLFGAFFAGAFVLRSTVCTLNDIMDREFDRKVERCKTRPIASGRVSVRAAVVFYLAQMGVVLGLMGLLSRGAKVWAVVGLHHVYPLLKRWTNWPQAWLGLAMNWGLPVAWAAVNGAHVELSVFGALLMGSWCWTVLYDTIYACQDIQDDAKAGVKSTALLFGVWILPMLRLFAAGLVVSLIATGVLAGFGVAYYAFAVGGVTLHLVWQFRSVDLGSLRSCGEIFKANVWVGGLIWAGLFGEYVLS